MVVTGYVQTKKVKTALSESTFLLFTCFIPVRKSNLHYLQHLKNKKGRKKDGKSKKEERKKEKKEGKRNVFAIVWNRRETEPRMR